MAEVFLLRSMSQLKLEALFGGEKDRLLWGLRASMSFTLSVSAQGKILRDLSPMELSAQGMSPSG